MALWSAQGKTGFGGGVSQGAFSPMPRPRQPSQQQGGGSIYGGGLMGQIGSAQATQGAQNYQGGTNQSSWGGGNVMGGMAPGQTSGFINAQGQPQSSINGGSRTMGSVNWNAVAGIQNYLNTINPAQRQQGADYLRSQGLMPTYNGFQLDRMPAQQTLGQPGGFDANAPGYFGSDGTYFVNQGNGNYVSQAQAEAQVAAQNRGGGGAPTPETPWRGTPGAPVSIPGGSLSFNANSGIDNYGRGPYGGQDGGYGGGSSGATFPLEGRMEQSINGILDNPSPYSQQQTQMMRNRSTSGIDQQRMEAQRQAGADAARRGLSPQEASANQSALGASYDRTRQGVQQDFELNNALASRQGLMQGLGAGQGLLGQQFGREADIMRYLAILGQTQAGNPPQFVQSL